MAIFSGTVLAAAPDKMGCDEAMEKGDLSNQIAVNAAWAEAQQCWKRSMNREVDKRLLVIKKFAPNGFHKEMRIQMAFNKATAALCHRDCEMGSLSATPNNYCDIAAFKFRTQQAVQINNHRLTVPSENMFDVEKARKQKQKFTDVYKDYISKVCDMPDDVRENRADKQNCQKDLYQELNEYSFTDDPCDLS